MYLTNMYAGSRVYTFEIKHSSNGNKYLYITEEREDAKGENAVIGLTIYEEYLPVFSKMVNAATEFITDNKDIKATSITHNTAKTKEASYTLEEKRKKHPKAYAKWTMDEDNRLRELFAEGRTVQELSTAFQRNRGAIESRLGKLGIIK